MSDENRRITKEELEKLNATLDGLKEQEFIGFNMMFFAMAYAIDYGWKPYVQLLIDETGYTEYKVFYNYMEGKGESKVFDSIELEDAAEWIRDSIENSRKIDK